MQEKNVLVTGVSANNISFAGYAQTATGWVSNSIFGKIPEIKIPKIKEEGMRAIYTTYIVSPKTEEILAEIRGIAENKAEAERKALMGRRVASLGLGDAGDYDIYTDETTDHFIRAKRDTQKVKIVSEE